MSTITQTKSTETFICNLELYDNPVVTDNYAFNLQIGQVTRNYSYVVQSGDNSYDVRTALVAQITANYGADKIYVDDNANQTDYITLALVMDSDATVAFIADVEVGSNKASIISYLPTPFNWCDDEANRLAPDASKRALGWVASERPSRNWWNHLLNVSGNVSSYLQTLGRDVSTQLTDIKNRLTSTELQTSTNTGNIATLQSEFDSVDLGFVTVQRMSYDGVTTVGDSFVRSGSNTISKISDYCLALDLENFHNKFSWSDDTTSYRYLDLTFNAITTPSWLSSMLKSLYSTAPSIVAPILCLANVDNYTWNTTASIYLSEDKVRIRLSPFNFQAIDERLNNTESDFIPNSSTFVAQSYSSSLVFALD